MQASILPLGQQESISDCAFDFYGIRLASVGLDAKIRLLRLNEQSGEWAQESEWRAHDAPITRIAWAHPEHGALLASSSFDRSVKVWQEAERVHGSSGGGSAAPRWIERAVLTEAKGGVRDVCFAPTYFGLKLASISADSTLRIYECLEIYNASQWELTEEIDISAFGTAIPPSLAPPFPNNLNTPGSSSLATPGGLQGSSFSAGIPTPGIENSSPTSSDGISRRPSTPSLNQANKSGPGAGSNEADSGWCVSWCKERWWGEVVAVSTGTNPTVKLVALPHAPAKPILLASLTPPSSTSTSTPTPFSSNAAPSSSQSQAITSISWAPMSGRSYHLIATGSMDSYVRVWKVKTGSIGGASGGGMDMGPIATLDEDTKWIGKLVGEFPDHKSAVGRVEWNITGTVLSSAGDDGQIRFWKALSNVWRKIGAFNTHHVVEADDGDAVMG